MGVANLATRATIEDDKLVEGNIGVTITSTGNDDRYKGSNVRWYGSNGVWGLVENQKVVLYEGNGESQKIYAYYPYAKDIIEGTENLPVTLPEAFGSNFEGYDYLCTKEGISLSQNPVSLTLSHAFSKVSVSVNVMGNELEGDMVTEIALVNVPFNGERSATTGAIDPDKYGPANGRIALYGYDGEDYGEVADYYIGYALPNAATTLDLRVTMQSGRVFTAKAPISGGMTDGVHYKIGLNLGKDKVGISSVTVAPWGTGGTIDGGVAEEVPQTYIYDATTNTYKVYQGDYLQTAIDEAEVTGTAENPATVKIMADMEITGVPDKYGHVDQNILVDAGVIILDLNGHLVKGMTDRHGINITDYATLTIDDSSESKQGKFMCKDHVLYMDEHAKLIINNGTFENWAESYDELEGVVLRGLGWDWRAIINGGTFVSVNYVIMMSATVEINGGTFIGENYALDISNGSNEPININGGSFVGGNYDLFIYSEDGAVPAFLSANAETGVGATFPGGLTIDYDEPKTLNDIIMDGVGYFDAEGNQITEGLDGTNIAGDVTVKRIH